MMRIKNSKSQSHSLVNKIAITIVILFLALGSLQNYYWLYFHSEDVVVLKAKVTEKTHSHVQFRERWSLRLDYWFSGELFHSSIHCTKENYYNLAIGDTIEVKINKRRPGHVYHIRVGIIAQKDIY